MTNLMKTTACLFGPQAEESVLLYQVNRKACVFAFFLPLHKFEWTFKDEINLLLAKCSFYDQQN